ncbi:MAG TPA: response regulator transcription factor [Bryobacteraceae bacterium]|nr:response regulator transcription factor [Bryobacteraceae bacterium]
MQRPIRLLIADHNRIFREGVCVLIGFASDLQLIAAVVNAEDAVNGFLEHRPDLTLMDLDMRANAGVDAIHRIRQIDPQAWVIALVTDECDSRTPQAIAAGASLVLTKDAVGEALLPAIYARCEFAPPAAELFDDQAVAIRVK